MLYKDLSKRQSAILDYIKEVIAKKGYPPSIREICDAVGLNSSSTAHSHLLSLEKKGYIRRDPLTPRAIELLEKALVTDQIKNMEMINVPIVGQISAGLPTLAEENIDEFFPLPYNFLNARSNSLFILHVRGESMIDVGIEDGDMLIVEQTSSARNGEIAVVRIDNEATVKTFYREQSRFRLQPENRTMQPIYVDHCEIIGKPVGLIRRFPRA